MPTPLRILPALLALFLWPATAAGSGTVGVYAAASLTGALSDIAKAWQSTHDVALQLSFAGSGTLAKQIEAGAPAQIFAAADKPWMDYLERRGLIDRASRRNLLGNSLVLITPRDRPLILRVQKDFNLAAAFTGKLCTGETGSVPVGVYAKEALQNLGWWPALAPRVVGAEDVRTALAFVERGECPLGIVYRTDALASKKVAIAGEFPPGAHADITYPFALLPAATPAARDFFNYLQGDDARRIFTGYGFAMP